MTSNGKASQDRLTVLLRTAQLNFVRIRSFIKVMDIGLQHAGTEILPTMEQSMQGIVAESEGHPPPHIFRAAVNQAVTNHLSGAA